jgi:hypothetical protein
MVYNYSNVNKANIHLSSQIIEHVYLKIEN